MMIKNFFKSFDPDRTVKHVSYREAKQNFEREKRLSDLLFKIVAIWSLIVFAVLAVISLMAR